MRDLDSIISEIIAIAKRYREKFDRPLGEVLGEIGEQIVASKFDLTLAPPQTPVYDANASDGRKIQIKSRIFSSPQTDTVGKVKEGDYDELLVASFNSNFELLDVYIVSKAKLEEALKGRKKRDPHYKLIQKIGISLREKNGWKSTIPESPSRIS